MTILMDMTQDQAARRIAELEAQLAAAKAAGRGKLTLKVSKAGAVSVYGMGKWPVTLYSQQWEKVLDAEEQIRAFIVANADSLSVKE